MGTYYIQLVDPAARQSTNLATGSVAPLGPGDVVLRADCVGHYLTLFIGGNPVFQVYDDTLSAGDVGVAATADQGGLVLLTRFRATGGG